MPYLPLKRQISAVVIATLCLLIFAISQGDEILVGLKKENSFSINRSPLIPTFVGPDLQIIDPIITDVSWSENDGLAISIGFEGIVFSTAGDEMFSHEVSFSPGYIYVNGELRKEFRIPLQPVESDSKTYSARFRKLLTGVPCTEGNNTIEVVFTDPVTGQESSELFNIVLEAPTEPGGRPRIVEQSRHGVKGANTEIYNYLILRRSEAVSPENSSEIEGPVLLFGGENNRVECETVPIGTPGVAYARLPGESYPLEFILVPSRNSVSREEQATLLKELREMELGAELSDRSEFLIGYSFGMFLGGGDAILSNGSLLENVVKHDLQRGGLTLNYSIRSRDEEVEKYTLCAPALDEEKLAQTDPGALFAVLFETARLFREEDPRKEDVVLALLLSDFASIGIEQGPTGSAAETLMKIAEAIEGIHESVKEESLLIHGVFMGHAMATAMQVDLPRPDQEGVWERPLKSQVLQYFLDHFPDPLEVLAGLDESSSPGPSFGDGEEDFFVDVPPGQEKAWAITSWFYRDIVWSDDTELVEQTCKVLPDSMKPPWVSPLLLTVGMLSLFVGGIWLLVVQFKTHLGWGFGQLGANIVSCVFVIPGLVVAIIFCCLHWKQARKPVTAYLLGWLVAILSLFFIPSWTNPYEM